MNGENLMNKVIGSNGVYWVIWVYRVNRERG